MAKEKVDIYIQIKREVRGQPGAFQCLDVTIDEAGKVEIVINKRI